MDEVKEQLKRYILSEVLPGEKACNLQCDTRLDTTGILDSMSTLFLIRFIEEDYKIEVNAHEVTADNFSSIDSIASFIRSKTLAIP